MPARLRAEVSAAIDRPIRDVFERFADPNFSSSVDPAQGSGARLVRGKPFEAGAVWEVALSSPLGGKMIQTQTISEYDPPDRRAVDLKQTGFYGREVETFSGTEDGAVKVTWSADWKLRWYVAPFGWLLQRKVQSGAEIWIVKMKEAIESGQAPPTEPN